MSAVVALKPDIDLFETYFEYVKDTEPPYIFHRWSLLACLGAWLGRDFYLPFGESRVYPNLFVQLVGDPGSRKSAAIKLAKKILTGAGYTTIAHTRSSKEKFLLDLEGEQGGFDGETAGFGDVKSNPVMQNLFGELDGPGDHREVLVAADEFNDFVGSGNLDFLSMLGTFWDWWDDTIPFTQRFKTSKSIAIWNPTVSILSGNTHTGLANCFSGDASGQGFMSRLLFIYGEQSGKRITIPQRAPEEVKQKLINQFETIKKRVTGPAVLSSSAHRALDTIYRTWPELEDARFKHYSNRRLTHLLKLVLIMAAKRCSTIVDEEDVVWAHTVLSFAEHRMSRALGEFGKAKNADVSNIILSVLGSAKEPVNYQRLWKAVSTELDRPDDLMKIIANLAQADKLVQMTNKNTGQIGYLPKKVVFKQGQQYINFDLLKSKEGSEK